MTTEMCVNDEKKDISSPLLTQLTRVDNEIIEIKSDLPDKDSKMNGTHIIPLDENMLKSMTISFENINYTINQGTTIKYFQEWKKIFSSCQQISNKQILFDLSGYFTPGMNAILGYLLFLFIEK